MILTATLHPHDEADQNSHCSISVSVDVEGRSWALVRFHITGFTNGIFIPPESESERRDDLWRTTCLEVFAELRDGRYAEFNISPSRQWAAYRFDGYREGMRNLEGAVRVTRVERTGDGFELDAILDWSEWPHVARLGLSAVIEGLDGAVSYWALAHASDKPDFHHPDSFVLDLT